MVGLLPFGAYMPNVVCLYDESGNMGRDWARAGFDVHCFDLKNSNTRETVGSGTITKWRANLLDKRVHAFVVSLAPVITFGFPPCTDLAVSGARHYRAKFAANPRFQDEALELVMVVPALGEQCACPWMAENPVGTLNTLWREPDYIFDPSDYGGYLPVDDVHPRWPEYIAPRDAYPKKTCIWASLDFVMPTKRPVKRRPGWSDQQNKLGGKSEKTKEIRSETPRGFALATFIANSDPNALRHGDLFRS